MKNGHTTRQKAPASRYALLDELRGLDLVSMMLYHACWDMMFLFGIWMDWYAGMPGRLWQQTICWVFILLSGFCGSRPSAGCSFCCPASVRPLGGICCGAVLPCLPPERW